MAPQAQAWLDANKDRQQPQQPVPTIYIEADGTGIPMVAEDLVGRKGKQADGSAKTREVKIGGVFTRHHIDPENS